MIRYWADKVRERTGDAFVKGLPRSVDYVLDDMLGVGDFIWPSVRTDLHNTFDYPINEVIKIDGVGSGKSTFASLAVIYSLQVLALMPDPARVFGLMPGSKIGIVIMSLREAQAKSIIFDEIKQRVNDCAWFKKNYRHKEEGSRLIRFPNRVFILSGSSSETVPAGFNVLIGIMDEGEWFLKQCLASGSLLTTKSGLSPIETLEACDEDLYDGEGWDHPTKFFNHSQQECLRIKLANGLRLIGHPTHRIRLASSKWRALKDLKPSDRVLVKQKVEFEGSTGIDFPGVNRRGLRKEILIPRNMSHELAWLLGYHAGDGSFMGNTDPSSSGVKFFYLKDAEGERIQQWMEDIFGVTTEGKPNKNYHYLQYYSFELRAFFEWLYKNFLRKYGRYYASWLSGFIQADGCRDGDFHNVEQKNKERSREAFYMALALGWAPRLTKTKHPNPADRTQILTYWKLRMRTPKDLDLIGKNHNRDWKPVTQQVSQVKSVQKYGTRAVFDITMPTRHLYLSNFIVSHNSHIGDSLDQAENVYMSMKDRVETRFGEKGLMILVSSARNPEGFMLKRYDEVGAEPDIYRTRRPQWEAKPGRWAPFFKVDLKNAKIVEEEIQEYQEQTDEFILVPHSYKRAFKRNPRKFLRDRGSIVLINAIAYVLRPDAILINMSRRNPVEEDGTISEWFKPIAGATYYSHNDLGETRDKLVLCVGHQEGYKTVIDLIYVIDPKEEGKADFERARQVFFELQRRGFQFGDEVTYDSWQSRDTIQRLEARGITAAIMSVDKDKSAYDMWLEAHYDDAIDVPYVDGYMDCVKSLIDKGNKVDHTKQGQKDITDAVAGTVKHCRMAGMNMATVMVAKREKAIAPIARAQIRAKFIVETDFRDQSLREAAFKF